MFGAETARRRVVQRNVPPHDFRLTNTLTTILYAVPETGSRIVINYHYINNNYLIIIVATKNIFAK